MDKIQWIKDLVVAEQAMEETGVIDVTAGFDPEQHLTEATYDFMRDLKAAFIEAASAFNQMKGSTLGTVKIYGISKTAADFMLFRNGCKLIFSMKQPGTVSMKFHRATGINPAFTPMAAEEEFLIAKWGPFGDLNWTYNNQPIKTDYLVKYYTTRFVHESAK